MSNEERPRLSLRLRGLSQDSGETPPASPPEPAPAEPPAAQQFKPRLNSLLSPAAAASPGSGLAPAAGAPAPTPEAVPSPATEPEPPPLPAAAYNAPPVRPAPPPPFRPLNPANFPPPPGYGKAKAPTPAAAAPASQHATDAAGTSGHRAGITLLILLALVIGSAAFVYFADPLGLFARAPSSSPVAKDPVPIAPPEPEPAAAQTAPASEPEATPEPPPQQGLETLPPPPPPPPPPQPEIINAIAALKFSGARMNSTGGSIMLGTKVYNAGEVINPELGITFVSFSDGTFTFRDDRGATYQRRF